ncbi:heat-inducible transcriptional repressor HrcA, partial [Escherichia coli]|nr:heat-inducible transcriptional repressor HrcA [Escherichia coli]
MTKHSSAPTPPLPPSQWQSLDTRSREIFRRLVDSYLKDGEPVGSRSLSRI